jgi:DNA-binding transcriptional regulator YdaS (Cro superfamily)
MDKLLAYLNSLSTPEQTAFALAIGSSVGYLRKACSDKRYPLGPELCVLIEDVTGGRISRRDLRPLDYMKIWPDLRTQAVG